MPDRSSSFRHADLLLKDEGGVVAFINTRRAEGLSWRKTALALRDHTDREVDLEQGTLRLWLKLGWLEPAPDDEPKAATG
jgi:hypothetical protein